MPLQKGLPRDKTLQSHLDFSTFPSYETDKLILQRLKYDWLSQTAS